MNYTKNEVKAGAFIVVCSLILAVFLIAISGFDFNPEKVQFRARYKYIGGITEGSLVRYGGMEVGHVVGIRVPDDGDTRIELVLEIDPNTPIKNDSEAFLTTIGFMGATYVEITLGSAEAARLPDNSLIKSIDITPLSQMSGSAEQITKRLEIFLDRLNDLLNQNNRDAFGALVQNTSAMLARDNGDMAVLLQNLNTLSLQLKSTVEMISNMVMKNEQVLAKGIEEIPEVVEQTKTVLTNLENTTAQLDRMMLTNSDNYNAIIRDMQQTAQNLQEFTQLIKEQPWLLVRKSAPKERKIEK